MTDQIFHDSEADRAFRARRTSGRFIIYGILILWAIIAIFPIYWTITTSFKAAPDVLAIPLSCIPRARNSGACSVHDH